MLRKRRTTIRLERKLRRGNDDRTRDERDDIAGDARHESIPDEKRTSTPTPTAAVGAEALPMFVARLLTRPMNSPGWRREYDAQEILE